MSTSIQGEPLAIVGNNTAHAVLTAERETTIALANWRQSQALVQQLKAENDKLKAENGKLKDDVSTLTAELYLFEELISNPTLQGNAARVMIATHKAIGKARARGYATKNGKYRVYREDVSLWAGCSEQAVSEQWGKVEESGLIAKEIAPIYDDETGEFVGKSAFIVIPKQVYLNPRGVALVTARQGGKRIPTCRECGSAALKKETRFICTGCGEVMNNKEIIMVSEEFLAREAQAIAEIFTPAPARPCLVCGVEDWIWNAEEKNWKCGNEGSHE